MMGKIQSRFPQKKVSRFFLSIGSLGLICFLWLIVIPSDNRSAILFGLSTPRLLMGAFLVFLAIFCYLITWKIEKQNTNWLKILSQPFGRWITDHIQFIFIFCILLSSLVILILPIYKGGQYRAYFQRLLPLITWLMGFGLFGVLFLTSRISNKKREFWQKQLSILKWAAFLLFGFSLIGCFISITKIGTIPDSAYWDDALPIPLLEGQLLGVFYFSVLFLILEFLFRRIVQKKSWQKKIIIDASLVIIIWLVAFLVWSNQPIPNSYFSPKVRPPNYEVYPFSDARLYDSDAQSFLLGELSINDYVIHKPLHVFYLSILHLIAGQDYQKIIMLQTAIFSFIPASLFLLGKEVHSRLAGLVGSGLYILREWNTLRVASQVTTSNTKLLMSELPTTLLIIFFALFFILWIKNQKEPLFYLFVSGIILGFVILYRSQTILFIVGIILFLIFFHRQRPKAILYSICIFLIGMSLILMPWIIRNYSLSGEFAIESTDYTDVVISLLSHDMIEEGGLSEQFFSGDRGFFGQAIIFALNNPIEVFNFTLNQYLHNEILSALTFPIRNNYTKNFEELVILKDAFWDGWHYTLSPIQIVYLTTYLLFISIGVSASIKKEGLIGFVPLLLHFYYIFTISVSRISGMRFILPVDWIVYFYFGVGIVQISIWFATWCGLDLTNLIIVNLKENENKFINKNYSIYSFIIVGIVGLIISASFPFATKIIPSKYRDQTEKETIVELFSLLEDIPNNTSVAEIANLINNKNLDILKGIALYPRHYSKDNGEPTKSDFAYGIKDYPRLMFLFIGDSRLNVEVRMDLPPNYFPHYSEVIIVGYEDDNIFRARLVHVAKMTTSIYYGN